MTQRKLSDGLLYFMAKELNWFKFSPLKWMTGRIRKESGAVQLALIELICQYWKNDGVMTLDQAELEIGHLLKPLIEKKIVKSSGEFIKIDFLDEQFIELQQLKTKRRSAASSRWGNANALQTDASAMQMHASAMQTDAERKKERKNTRAPVFENAFDDLYIDQLRLKWSHIDFDFEFKTFCDKVAAAPDRYADRDTSGLRLAFLSQLRTAKSTPKVTPENDGVWRPKKFEQAEIDKRNWILSAWEEHYEKELKRDNEFRKHFGYEELRISKPMGKNGKGNASPR